MILQALAFYVFAFVVMASAAMVVVSRNPVYSVLFLILAFFNAAALFVLVVVTDVDPPSGRTEHLRRRVPLDVGVLGTESAPVRNVKHPIA